MQAGRELDALVAEKVMGWTRKKVRLGRQSPGIISDGARVTEFFEVDALVKGDAIHSFEGYAKPYNVPSLPHYSTSIEEAWEVAQKVKDMDEDHEFIIHLSDSKHGECAVEIKYWDESNPNDPVLVGPIYVLGKDAPHAICLAALRAVGVSS